ncbi:hypothetical protein N7501_011241 [Penicillium viridicatum]|nr:hypothetical protein N7501_011241 [Penicillium viridicatum]
MYIETLDNKPAKSNDHAKLQDEVRSSQTHRSHLVEHDVESKVPGISAKSSWASDAGSLN